MQPGFAVAFSRDSFLYALVPDAKIGCALASKQIIFESGCAVNKRKIYYFDNNATTRVAPEVVDAMLPFLSEHWGNASSAYSFGKEVARYLKEAPAKVAALVNANPKEIPFTSCGKEGTTTAIHSALARQARKQPQVS